MNTSARKGILLALSAYILWGITPMYFKWVANENPLDVVANRVLWSVILLAIVLSFMAKWGRVKAVLCSFDSVKLLLGTTLLIGMNWSVFIYAISSNRMLDASLGYYINPLVSVLLGFVFLKERFTRAQSIALILAMIGVGIQVVGMGYVPWISLALALSFGFYGLLHKQTTTDSFTALFVETSLLLPLALLMMGYLYNTGEGPANRETSIWFILMLAGPVTTIPLLLFSAAAKSVPLGTLGFLQYIAPSMVFGLAIFVYDEPLDPEKGLTFVFIWAGLLVFALDSMRRKSKGKIKEGI